MGHDDEPGEAGEAGGGVAGGGVAGDRAGRGLLRAVDSVQVPVPDLDAALAFYRDGLGQELVWRTATAAAVRLPGSEAELVLQVERDEPEVDLLVASADDAVAAVVRAGGAVVVAPFDIPVGRVARVADPFGTVLTLVDLSHGRYATAPDGAVTGVASPGADRDGALPPNRSVPASAVVPVLTYPDVEGAVAWLTAAFGLVERVRIGPNHRAQLRCHGGDVVAADTGSDRRPPRPGEVTASVLVRVADVDAHCRRAREHGARVLQEPADQPYGERQYTAEDLAGHRWTFMQTLADVPPEAWGGESIHP